MVAALHTARAQAGLAAIQSDNHTVSASASRGAAPLHTRLADAARTPLWAKAARAGQASLPPSRVPAFQDQLSQNAQTERSFPSACGPIFGINGTPAEFVAGNSRPSPAVGSIDNPLEQGVVDNGAGRISVFPPNQQHSSAPLRLQAKLTVGEPGDKLEVEADQVADRVMRMPYPAAERVLQRKCAECEEEDAVRRKTLGTPAGATAIPPIVHDVLRSPGEPLDAATRAFMELQFSHDFGRVRVHSDARASESARAVNALAYTVGSHIVLPGQNYAPHGIPGKKLLAHELTHVIQQGQSAELGGAVTTSGPEASRRAMGALSNPAGVPALQRKTVCDDQGVCHTEDDTSTPATDTPPAEADWHAPMADPSVTPSPSVDSNAGPNQSVDPSAGPNQSVDPSAGPNQSVDPSAGPNQSVDPSAGPNQSVDPSAGPNQSVDPSAGPNQSVDPNAAPAGASVPSSGGHIYFDYDQSVLRPDAISAIDTYAAQYLASSQDTDINVMGWASVEGSTDYNDNLSVSRATVVKNELVAQGVSDAHVGVGAGGETSQFSSDFAPNRRVEITPPQSGESSQPKCPLPDLPTITIASIASKLDYYGTASVDYQVQGVGTGPGVVFYPKVETGGDHIVVQSAPYLPDEMRADNAMGTFGVQGVATGRTQIAISLTDPCNETVVSNYIPFSVDATRGTSFTLSPVSGMDGGEVLGLASIVYALTENWPLGRTTNLRFEGLGFTGGCPVAITGPGSPSSFTTPTPMRIEDFEGPPPGGRITSAGYESFIGGGYAVLTFPNGVQVQGFGTQTGFGCGASVYFGAWSQEGNFY
jgi:outer membrane protein OmpA-like peptidoglycan-associated protein